MSIVCLFNEQMSESAAEDLIRNAHPIISKLEQQLTAEIEARKKLEFTLEETRDCLLYERNRLADTFAKLESAEQRIRDSQEQEPRYEVYCGGFWVEVSKEHYFNNERFLGCEHRISYAAPIPPADVAELQRELAGQKELAELYKHDYTKSLCENAELKIDIFLSASKNGELTRKNSDLRAEVTRLSGECERLGRKLEEQESQNNFDATRLRRLVAFCGVSAPDSDEELLQVAGVVIGACLRVLQRPETSMLDKSSEIGVLKHHLSCKNLQIENLTNKSAAQQAVLIYLMERFDNETWQCEKCGHAEDTSTMDSASYLRSYLSTNSSEELTRLIEQAKQQAVPEWKPIETAPKDEVVLVICNGHVFSAAQENGKWYWGILVPEQLKLSLVLKPTYWMPLAPQPSPESAEERKDEE